MSHLVEQMGRTSRGAITGILTVLVDGDDLDEPISDSVRSFVDGHIILSRQLAEKGHFPAIDVLKSTSRLFRDVTDEAHQRAAQNLRSILATHNEVGDLIRIGAYQGGSDEVDKAIRVMPKLNGFLQQKVGQASRFSETRKWMEQIAAI